jgi:hypothetical protein
MIASLLVWTDLTASAVTDQNHGFRMDTNLRRIGCRRNSDANAFVHLIDDASTTRSLTFPILCIRGPAENRLPIRTIRSDLEEDLFALRGATARLQAHDWSSSSRRAA